MADDSPQVANIAYIAKGGSGELVSSLRIFRRSPAHDIVQLWNRGGLAGSLTVNAGDGQILADRLLPPWQRLGEPSTKEPPVRISPESLEQRARWLRSDNVSNPYSGVFDLAAAWIRHLEGQR